MIEEEEINNLNEEDIIYISERNSYSWICSKCDNRLYDELIEYCICKVGKRPYYIAKDYKDYNVNKGFGTITTNGFGCKGFYKRNNTND